MYGFNFEHDFIVKAFCSRGEAMVRHLQAKFLEAYERAGTYGAFFYFWSMLDNGNKKLLEDYVLEQYSNQ